MAYVSSAMSIGLILGPVLGGIIYARCGYYAAFGLAFGIITLDLILRVTLVEKKIAIRYDSPSLSSDEAKSQSLKLSPLQPAPITEGPTNTSEESAELVTEPAFSVHQSRIPTVIRILKYPRLLVALFLSFVQALILSAFDATLPLYVNALFSFTAL